MDQTQYERLPTVAHDQSKRDHGFTGTGPLAFLKRKTLAFYRLVTYLDNSPKLAAIVFSFYLVILSFQAIVSLSHVTHSLSHSTSTHLTSHRPVIHPNTPWMQSPSQITS